MSLHEPGGRESCGTTPEGVLRFVIAGHVDHGKSTLAGRLLHETGHLPEARRHEIEASSKRRGMRMEWAFALDALQAERDQAITIDATQAWFRTRRRAYCLIDAPGHREFLRNMMTAASRAEAALLLVDATEGASEQSYRHASLLQMIGLRELAVVVNKMDLAGYSQVVFERIRDSFGEYLSRLGLSARAFVPVSATEGDGIAARSDRMPWYDGPPVTEVLDSFEPEAPLESLPLRFSVQGVYKFDHRRLIAGRVECGVLREGDRVIFSPCNKISTVASLERFPPGNAGPAVAGESVAFTLKEQIFVQRGETASHPESPPLVTNELDAKIFWLGRNEIRTGTALRLKVMTLDVPCTLEAVHRVIDTESLDALAEPGGRVGPGAIAEVTIRTRAPVAIDSFDRIRPSGRFVLLDDHGLAGGGTADVTREERAWSDRTRIESREITWTEPDVARRERERRNGHRGVAVWLTGLSGAGKSTIAREIDRQLYLRGCHSYVLDGDNVRHGLSRNLGFSPEDRAENIRRVGEVARLMADSGTIVVTAFISPYRAERELVRTLFGEDEFFEVFVSCPLEICERRDPKGLYRKARKGELRGFTGIEDPYEPPQNPDLVLETDHLPADECAGLVVAHLADHGVFRA